MLSTICRRYHQRMEIVDMKNRALKAAAFGFGMARSMHFTLQGLWLPVIDRAMNGKTERTFGRFQQHLQKAFPKVKQLLQIDAENISQGTYPASVLFGESIIDNYRRFPFLLADTVRAHQQRKTKKNAEFDQDAKKFLSETPEYYQRNFHFQKNGYLSDDSADLYEHQVEVLFSGTAQAMRRQIIKPMKDHFNSSNGEGLKILEVGCGTGALSRSLALAFPKAKIFCLDLSPHYLKKAQKNLAGQKNVSFVEGLAETLDFKDESFDAVVSCYLFHELPQAVREKVILEKWRVLKKNGFFGMADSIQTGDDDELQWALDQFPVDFHEPFYKNYINHPLENVVENLLQVRTAVEIHFLAKILFSVKPGSLK